MGIISSKLRASAKGQPCMFQIPDICQPNNETVCLCHLPSDIKGMGNKSDDFHAAFGCYSCHQVIDNHRLSKELELYYSMRALQRTLRNWVTRGLITIPVDKPRPKPSSKIVPRSGIYKESAP
ncbi:nuclease domain-containing protein [Mesorhizobium caraganae]|uniref:nuclease domain-containing protein n=1 Tax=Mesorhizobium caraganae TaxID=483206 RepID=UPI00177ADBEE|nr:nuclease domain-containing protein [Mesorhizobium caraganae]